MLYRYEKKCSLIKSVFVPFVLILNTVCDLEKPLSIYLIMLTYVQWIVFNLIMMIFFFSLAWFLSEGDKLMN